MNNDDLYTHEGLVSFRALAAQCEACPEALDYLDECIALGLTLEQATVQAQDYDGHEGKEYQLWVRTEMRDQLSENFRVMLTDLITRDDPRMAAHVDLYFDDLNEVEAALVVQRWSVKDLPNLANQVAKGRIRRARH